VTVSSAGTVVAVKIGIADMLCVFLFELTQVHSKIAFVDTSTTCRARTFNPEHLVVIDEFAQNCGLYLFKEKNFVFLCSKSLVYYIFFHVSEKFFKVYRHLVSFVYKARSLHRKFTFLFLYVGDNFV